MDRNALLIAGDRNLAQVLRHGARTTPDGALDDDGRLLLVSTSRSWPGPYHNGALRLDRSLEAGEVLARAGAFFAGRCPGYCVWIAAHTDSDLEDVAVAAGLVPVSTAGGPRMALEHGLSDSGAVPGVGLGEVTDEAGRLAYLAVTVAAYDEVALPARAAETQLARVAALRAPGVRSVVAYDALRPVGAAMVVVAAGVAGIQLVGTVPDARGRGIGELCTRWAVNEGFRLGASAAVLEASEQGEPLYRRMGFVEVSRYRWCFGSAGPVLGNGGREAPP